MLKKIMAVTAVSGLALTSALAQSTYDHHPALPARRPPRRRLRRAEHERHSPDRDPPARRPS